MVPKNKPDVNTTTYPSVDQTDSTGVKTLCTNIRATLAPCSISVDEDISRALHSTSHVALSYVVTLQCAYIHIQPQFPS